MQAGDYCNSDAKFHHSILLPMADGVSRTGIEIPPNPLRTELLMCLIRDEHLFQFMGKFLLQWYDPSQIAQDKDEKDAWGKDSEYLSGFKYPVQLQAIAHTVTSIKNCS